APPPRGTPRRLARRPAIPARAGARARPPRSACRRAWTRRARAAIASSRSPAPRRDPPIAATLRDPRPKRPTVHEADRPPRELSPSCYRFGVRAALAILACTGCSKILGIGEFTLGDGG